MTRMRMSDAALNPDLVIDELIDALGVDQVRTGDDVHGRSAGIWRSDTIKAKALLRPATTQEVSRVLAICYKHGQSVVAHGGLTGLVESALTEPDDIVLSLERMNQIDNIDPVNRTMSVQAGAILQTVQEAADEHGLMFPLDIGGRGSATIGGNISTNAGGNRVIRFGMIRDMVLGLEAVLADGTIVTSMNEMIKNNAGYDLKQLFIGTEGSLGIVTRAVLRLREKPLEQATVFVAVDDFDKLGLLLKKMDAGLGGALSAFEVMWNNFYTQVTTPPAMSTPPISQAHPYYVLIEAMGADASVLERTLTEVWEADLVCDAVLAQTEAQRLQLWALRDDVEQCLRKTPWFIFDVSLPIQHMQGYVDQVNAGLQAEFETYKNFTFGHMGDGNLHFVVAVETDDRTSYTDAVKTPDGVRHRVEACVYGPLKAINGSVSAEHGVGLEKKPWLHISRSPNELKLMAMLKTALDPKGILNPGKVF